MTRSPIRWPCAGVGRVTRQEQMKGYGLATALDTKIDELGGVVITYGEQPDAAVGSGGARCVAWPFFCPALSPTPHRG